MAGDDSLSEKRRLVRFEPHDPENPQNWPQWRKLLAWLPIIPVDLCVSFGASGYSPATTKFTQAFGVSSEVGILGLSMYTIALALGPMLNAPLSEYYGRLPIYIISYALSLPFYVGCALAPNLGGFLAMRFFCGLFQSVTIAALGGTIADLYTAHHTGYPMSVFLWAAVGGSSIGFFLLSFVAQYRPWYDIFWALLGISGGCWGVMSACLLYCGETRHSVILRRRANRLRKQTGDTTFDVPDDYRRTDFSTLMRVTQTRPFRFLLHEAIIFMGALYNGYLYGISFLLNGAFTLVFGPHGHGFDTLHIGLCFLGIAGGVTVGPLTNILQEQYYQRRVRAVDGANVPEARVMMGKIAAVTLPISLFWFAWTTYSFVHPAVPIVATALFGWSFYTILLMTYTYTEDSYKQYSASALAGLGFVRNILGGGFPLFGNQMFENEGYQWAGSILAFLSLVLVPIPFVLDRYGFELRKRSPWAREHLDEKGGQIAEDAGGEEGPAQA
ncbi:hypothetical protein BAUCODRAFT_177171 [Baudoinia panamericana UAMH 10762]|uniref:Major facilitator superfamily (MFS) profile domain-containing protein n=1 Tax=Baudoinia panamericana (strain UAMH 10762) TaxID=717646 RepID=M2M0S8_BAUPA|nr:uncharacterized protein BAUCODRAFT_177171 [Baudoinia panamericana UAMH 10762]EMD00623.1 hypothetical protein BAUCODRAFT_177171 [Baudoinia panamericana UAMH 10762]